MNLDFQPESTQLLMCLSSGMKMLFNIKMGPDSNSFQLKSGIKLSESIFSLTVFPLSESPHKAVVEDGDGRVGELRPTFVRLDGGRLEKDHYSLWLHVPDNYFNVLYAEASKGVLPDTISVVINDGYGTVQPGDLIDLVWDDLTAGFLPLPIRDFSFLFSMVKRS